MSTSNPKYYQGKERRKLTLGSKKSRSKSSENESPKGVGRGTDLALEETLKKGDLFIKRPCAVESPKVDDRVAVEERDRKGKVTLLLLKRTRQEDYSAP